MYKKILVLLLALMMVVGVFACKPAATTAPATADGAATHKAAFITQALSNESQAYAWKQFQQYCG